MADDERGGLGVLNTGALEHALEVSGVCRHCSARWELLSGDGDVRGGSRGCVNVNAITILLPLLLSQFTHQFLSQLPIMRLIGELLH